MSESEARRLMFSAIADYLDAKCCGDGQKLDKYVNMSTINMAADFRIIFPDSECPYDAIPPAPTQPQA